MNHVTLEHASVLCAGADCVDMPIKQSFILDLMYGVMHVDERYAQVMRDVSCLIDIWILMEIRATSLRHCTCHVNFDSLRKRSACLRVTW